MAVAAADLPSPQPTAIERVPLGEEADGLLGSGLLVRLVLDRLNAASSKAAYRRALRDFLSWYATEPGARFDKATVQRYRAQLLNAGLAPSSINQRLCAVRALAQEAADNHLVDATTRERHRQGQRRQVGRHADGQLADADSGPGTARCAGHHHSQGCARPGYPRRTARLRLAPQ